MTKLPISTVDNPRINIPVAFSAKAVNVQAKATKTAIVLSRETGHYLIDGQSLRTVSIASQPRLAFIAALKRGYKVVNSTSQLGLEIVSRLHSHVKRLAMAGKD